jgi:hypothetical protein
MRKVATCLVLVAAGIFAVAGCSSPPAQELDAAKASIQGAATAGAEKYAPEDLKKLNGQLAAANDEIKAQDEKWFKSYDKAKEMLTKVKADADSLKPTLAAKKDAAKNAAAAAQSAAKGAVDEAKSLLAKAPVGKDSRAEIEAMKADVKGLDEGLAEAEKLAASEDYTAAADKAKAISEKAVAVSDQVKQAMEKVAAGKKKVKK